MKEAFAIVRPACDFAGVLADSAMLNIVDGRMEAFNSVLQVSHPTDLKNMTLPAIDFDFSLRKVTELKSHKLTDTYLTLKGANGSTTRIKRMPNAGALKKPDIKTKKIKDVPDLLAVLSDVFAFTVGDQARPWSEGARFDLKQVTATNSVVLCQAELKNASPFEGLTIPRAGLAYIVQRGEALSRWGWNDGSIMLEFEDGGWALVSRMSMEMPDAAVGLLSSINDWTGFREVDLAYRAAVDRAIEYADKAVEVRSDCIYGARYSLEHKAAAETNLGDLEGSATFDPKNLGVVIAAAAEIGFDRYPNPVPFVTKRGSRGVIAGLAGAS